MSNRQNRLFSTSSFFTFNRDAKSFEAARDICDIYDEDTMPVRMAQNWFQYFKNNHFDLKDMYRSGHVVMFKEERLNHLLHKNSR